MSSKKLLLLLLLVCPLASAQTIETPPSTEGGRLIQSLVEAGRMDELRWPDFSDYRRHLRNFYGPAGYALQWTANGKPTPQTLPIIALFEAADAKGINAVDYDAPRWKERLGALTNETALARFDLLMSVNLMRYISDLHIGRINPRNLRFDLDIETKKYYLPKLLADIRVAPDPIAILNTIEPDYDEYRRLQQALATYRQLAADTANDKPLPVVKSLKRGEAYPALARLAKLLRGVGDLPADATVDEKTYAEPLVAAVKHFQSRHGIEPDGVIAEKTFRALNVPMARRLRQIQWALERWRWAPLGFPAPPIIVNIPEFVLRGWDETNKTAISMRVVVGQAYTHQTPIFADEMRYVVFRPYWNVPPTIQINEIVPHLEKSESYLANNHYEIVGDNGQSLGTAVTPATLAGIRSGDLRIRQKPGPDNALGLIKFIFPNENNVYFHSTPSQQFFSRTRRDFSHGCIRVEDPVALAAWVLRDQPQWTVEKIKEAMQTGDTKSANLTKPIPIMILYTTATVLENGEIHFFEDIYGHDATLENALAAGYPYPA